MFSHKSNIPPSWRRLLRPVLGPEALAAVAAVAGPGRRHQVLGAEELVPEVTLQTHLGDVDEVGRKDCNSILEFGISSEIAIVGGDFDVHHPIRTRAKAKSKLLPTIPTCHRSPWNFTRMPMAEFRCCCFCSPTMRTRAPTSSPPAASWTAPAKLSGRM